jgi:predicted Zn-dependent protease
LNRRTERDWLQSACRSASRAGKGEELLAFFEKQRQRSPRDVRWAVAVRDIKQAFHQVDGAIEAAQAAVAVRPDWDALWREAADLMVRADRIREAADYLEGWNRPRPADEAVAGWRPDLPRGDGEKALAIEQAALAATPGSGTTPTASASCRAEGRAAGGS